jgi:hypothetical protein
VHPGTVPAADHPSAQLTRRFAGCAGTS